MIIDLILYFFIYSVLGYVLETVYAFVCTGKYQKRRTMLYSPMCTVYGLGAAGMLVSLSWARDSLLLLFCGGFFVCASIEYLVSLVSERLYGVLWWDYSTLSGNVNGRICAFYSLCWGIIAIVFFRFIHPWTAYVVETAGIQAKVILAVMMSAYFIRDMRITARELKKFGQGQDSVCASAFPFLKTARQS